MQVIEKIGSFYLGKVLSQKEKHFNLDSKQLTTHAVCLGMTGSGKTGLGIVLLEEAGLDKIPALIIDPKGDLGNLLLTFPKLRPSDFRPWIDDQEAERQGMTPAAYAETVAETWRTGLAAWQEDPERIKALRDAVDMAIYTPASRSGIPLSILNSFKAPSKEIIQDSETFRDRVISTTSSILSLLGISADPVKSREHILIANILTDSWKKGQDLAITTLIQYVQKPPFKKVGALDIDTFFPQKERTELSISLNNLLASPGFQAWMEGEPLDIQNLLYTKEGKPRLAILSIAHLSENERMFFVTIFLNELLSWVRRQPGTSSLRALLYMDEIFGYFPPNKMPPSKMPMLTLLKQARAYGLGIVLATQNPVDLDYKGLSNCGLWFIGRLQTERDRSKVLEGLKTSAKEGSNSNELDKMLAATGKRIFMMRSVYEDKLFLFETRWTLSYLRGPLTLSQISRLTDHSSEVRQNEISEDPNSYLKEKPIVPTGLSEYFGKPKQLKNIVYTPFMMGIGKLHYVDAKNRIDCWKEISCLAPLDDEGSHVLWEEGDLIPDLKEQLEKEPQLNSLFQPLPGGIKNSSTFTKTFSSFLYQNQPLTLFCVPSLGIFSKPEESESEFRSRLALILKEKRSEAIEKLDNSYRDKMNTLEDRIRREEQRAGEAKQKALWAKVNTFLSFITSVLGIIFGKKLTKGTIDKTGTTLRKAGKISGNDQNAERAEEKISSTQQRLEDLQKQIDEEKQEIASKYDPDKVDLESTKIAPRKSDIAIEKIAIVWWPK